jgi:GTP-binding protein EngB required for normal cell division
MNLESPTLRDYNQNRLALANQLRLLREGFKKSGNADGEKQCEELMVKLAEDRFTLAVLGQFKRGKSSLMNAIIGRELLPTGVLPLTSAITVLKFGPTERLVVEREGWAFPETVPVSQLEDYVTERGNPGNEKKVKTATVEAPVPFLRRGLEFVDTPGVGSAIVANTATTYAFLPHCDAVLFVTSAESPLTGAEWEFLETIRQHVHKIFFVVNKMDLLAESERNEVLDFVAASLHRQLGANDLRLFPLSCKLALAGHADSGLPELQAELGRFLSDERAATFLDAIAQRVARLSGTVTRPVPGPAIPKPSPTKTATRYCPVCDHLYQVAFDFFAQWQYAIATDEKAQLEFADELGFCPLHTWQLNALSSPVGQSVGYAKLVERVARSLRDSGDAGKLVREPKNCRVCRLLRDAEKECVAQPVRDVQRVCLRHLALMVAAADDPEVKRKLLAAVTRDLEEIAEDMQSFALKTDALRRYLRNADEQDAYLRALSHLAGNRSVCFPWQEEMEL